MPNRGKSSKGKRRNQQREGGGFQPPVGCVALGPPSARLTTYNVTSMFMSNLTLKASGSSGQSAVTAITLKLSDMYPMPESDDKWAEYRFIKADLFLVGFSSLNADEYPGTAIVAAPHTEYRIPGNIGELCRGSGARIYPILACQNGAVKISSTAEPRFDETGSKNHFVNDFLATETGKTALWRAFVIAVHGPSVSHVTKWELKVALRFTLQFRGRQ